MAEPLDRIRERIARFQKERPHYREILDLYALILEEQVKMLPQLQITVPKVDKKIVMSRVGEGFPLLGREGFAIDLEAAQKLRQKGTAVRVVDMASWELFELQPRDYRNGVLPPDITARVAIETGVSQGWDRYVGDRGEIIGMNRFGASAPYQTLFEKFGFTADHVVEKVLGLIGKGKSKLSGDD